MSWNAIRDGWGLEKVPDALKDGLCCAICQSTKTLWCGQAMPVDDGSKGTVHYEREIRRVQEAIRNYVFCRYHAEWYYKENES